MFQQPTKSMTNMSTPPPQQWFLLYHLCWSSPQLVTNTDRDIQNSHRFSSNARDKATIPWRIVIVMHSKWDMPIIQTPIDPLRIVGWRGRVVTVVTHFLGICTPWKINRWNPKNGGLEDHFCFSIGWLLRFHMNFSGVYIIHHKPKKTILVGGFSPVEKY